MAITEYRVKRRVNRRRLRVIISAGIALTLIVLFIWSAVSPEEHLEAPPEPSDYQTADPPLSIEEAVQKEIDALEWIIPDFIPVNKFSRPGTPVRKVNSIVIHYIGNPATTSRQNSRYFASLAESGETYASSNFIIGLEGEILQCVPVNEIAYASNNRNEDSISIECCHPDETGKFTDETYDAVVRLTAWLCNAFDLNGSDVIRHYDVSGKECPKYFVDNEDAWERFKQNVETEMRELAREMTENVN